MSNLHNDNHHNLVSFLRQNQPTPPDAHQDLEQHLIESLEPRSRTESYKTAGMRWGSSPTFKFSMPAKLIATGFLLTSVSFGVKTPRLALEPKDLENFLVKNWHNTLENNSYTAIEQTEAYWLLPTISEPTPALSVSAH